MNNYKITVLKGDGIGPEIVDECIKVLDKAGEKFGFSLDYDYQLLGGAAIDEYGKPYPEQTEVSCKAADAVLLGSVGGPKWDTLPSEIRPEKGLLAIRESLGLFANLRPAKIFAPLKSASLLSLKLSATSLIFSLYVSLQEASISATEEHMRRMALSVHMIPSVTPILKSSVLSRQALNML